MTQVEGPEAPASFEPGDVSVLQFVEQNPSLQLASPDDLLKPSLNETRSTAQSLLDHHSKLKFKEAYKNRNGRCLIINNRIFSAKGLSERIGTDADRDGLRELFENLRYNVDVLNDCTGDKILENCSMFIQNEIQYYDSFVVCILSHGIEQAIYGTDGKKVQQKDILSLLNDPKNKYLCGKPKLVIFQACRVTMKQSILRLCFGKNAVDKASEKGEEKVEARNACEATEFDSIVRLLRESNLDGETFEKDIPRDMHDIIIVNSTLPGELSWRHRDKGSWFIQAMILVFKARQEREHVADMMVIVRNVVKEAFHGVQVPSTVSHLNKKLFFFPNAR